MNTKKLHTIPKMKQYKIFIIIIASLTVICGYYLFVIDSGCRVIKNGFNSQLENGELKIVNYESNISNNRQKVCRLWIRGFDAKQWVFVEGELVLLDNFGAKIKFERIDKRINGDETIILEFPYSNNMKKVKFYDWNVWVLENKDIDDIKNNDCEDIWLDGKNEKACEIWKEMKENIRAFD